MAERAPGPTRQTIETGDVSQYRYYSHDEVIKALGEIGYGSKKMLVDAFYLHETKNIGIGVLLVTPERCEDHFDILRGVDQTEASAQSLLLFLKFKGLIEGNKKPLFAEIENYKFLLPVIADLQNPGNPAQLNLVVTPLDQNDPLEGGLVESVIGDNVVSRGTIMANQMDTDAFSAMFRRRMSLQRRYQPQFPYQG